MLIRADALVPREIDPVLPPGGRALARALRLFCGPQARRGRPGERLAHALERLGPAAIKLGQVLSTRADIFGRAFADDLSHLKDQLAPFPTETARKLVAEALDHPEAAGERAARAQALIAEQFTLERMLDQTAAVYDQCLGLST